MSQYILTLISANKHLLAKEEILFKLEAFRPEMESYGLHKTF